MSEIISVCTTDALLPGDTKVVVHNDEQILLLNVDGAYYAVMNRCPHAAGPLDHGYVEGGRIVCPWHGWSFPVSPDDPPNDGLPRYRVLVEDGEVKIEYPAIEAEKGWR